VGRYLRPAVEEARPILGIIQPIGWVVIAVVVAALAVGDWLHWHEFLVIGLFLLVLVVGSVYFVLGRVSYSVQVDMTRLRVRVGDDAHGGLTVRNTSARRLRPSVFLVPIGQATRVFDVGHLTGHDSFYESFGVDTSQRAVVPLGPVRSSRGDGLGLLRREQKWTEVQELFIHPRTVSLADSSAGFLRDLEGRPTDTLSSSDIAFHALRDYVVGDDLRHVHWKTSARTGRLVVRQFEETRRSHLVVCLSGCSSDYASAADFELAVSVAASLGQQAILQEKDLTIAVPGGFLNTVTGMIMLDGFSRLELADRIPPVEAVALEAANASPDASAAMVITGTQVEPGRLHAACSRFGVDVLTVVLRCEIAVPMGRSSLGDSAVLTLGSLNQLPRMMRSLEV